MIAIQNTGELICCECNITINLKDFSASTTSSGVDWAYDGYDAECPFCHGIVDESPDPPRCMDCGKTFSADMYGNRNYIGSVQHEASRGRGYYGSKGARKTDSRDRYHKANGRWKRASTDKRDWDLEGSMHRNRMMNPRFRSGHRRRMEYDSDYRHYHWSKGGGRHSRRGRMYRRWEFISWDLHSILRPDLYSAWGIFIFILCIIFLILSFLPLFF